MESPAVRELVHRNKANVIGLIYDVASGPVGWLPEQRSEEILKAVEERKFSSC